MKKACKNCHKLVEGNTCPVCNGQDFSTRWGGLAIIIDVENSEVAKKLEIKQKGEYALIVQ